jgi:hypothetical protein
MITYDIAATVAEMAAYGTFWGLQFSENTVEDYI